tara:strand:- start:456 stop:584 length:129 start_codon:yes stop_codon:yes gene_type:complete
VVTVAVGDVEVRVPVEEAMPGLVMGDEVGLVVAEDAVIPLTD